MNGLTSPVLYLASAHQSIDPPPPPNFELFGVAFTTWWSKGLLGLFVIALVYCVFKLITAAASLQSSKKTVSPSGAMDSVAEPKALSVTGAPGNDQQP